MNGVLDNSLVGLALLVSAGYAALALGPRGVRRGMLKSLSWVASHTGFTRTAERLAVAASGKAAGACGGCDDCGSDKPSAKSADGEVRVPVAKIGRR